MLLCAYLANATMVKGAGEGSNDLDATNANTTPRIMLWMSPTYLSGFMLFLFTLIMFFFGVNMLGGIMVPNY